MHAHDPASLAQKNVSNLHAVDMNLIPQIHYLRYLEQHQNVICYYKMAWEKVK
jgi:intergrase/recombinase